MDRRPRQGPVSRPLTAPGLSLQLARSRHHRPARIAAREPGYRVADRFGEIQVDFLGATGPEAEQHEIEVLARTCKGLGHSVTEITVYGAPGLQVQDADQQQEEPMSYPYLFSTPGVGPFAEEVDIERQRQLGLWGDQRHPDGTGGAFLVSMAETLRTECREAAERGEVTWRQILMEELAEAFAETDRAKLTVELVQAAAVIAAWISDLNRRPQ
ncbi:hypothetical protein [Streptacidiphilus sp. MAP5-52]|uniref:hypothetical protein n=1 Tax=Streptacidiphilus sp. MAP5-52 TaxID=3156267 RepID=UPI0035146581